jgi:myo-inositol-1(or 4)-monophosphatase
MKKELETAKSAAQTAGAFLASKFKYGVNGDFTFKDHDEPVSKIDQECENVIVETIKDTFPEDKILTEENAESHGINVKSGRTWVIDPLDGTTNFLHGFPIFCVSIALIKDNDPVVGVIYDPTHDLLYTSIKGEGAECNKQKLSISKEPLSPNGVVFTGRWHKAEDKKIHANILQELEPKTPHLRRWGSAALMLASVASGQAEAVVLTGKKLWDAAAGVLLVKEAGGIVTEQSGEVWKPNAWTLVAGNRPVHENIVEITQKYADNRKS